MLAAAVGSVCFSLGMSLLLCPTSIMAYRVPVPVHINNLGTPRVQQIGQLSAKPAVAVLPETAGLQHSRQQQSHVQAAVSAKLWQSCV